MRSVDATAGAHPPMEVVDEDGPMGEGTGPDMAGAADAAAAGRPAHRPSRRRQIIDAATAVFAREGYREPTVEDVAHAAGVAPTAIYYHFGGKEELFAETLRAAMLGFSEQIFRVRPDTEAGTVESLREIVRAGWDWWYTHPDAARLVVRYSEGSTAHALQLRRQWEERHLQRAYDYLPEARTLLSARRARDQHAAHTLTVRVMLDVILASQTAMLEGVVRGAPRPALVAAVEEMCVSLILSLR
jgi:AcrR family transcriptional regulator